jgi:hypothetical protein
MLLLSQGPLDSLSEEIKPVFEEIKPVFEEIKPVFVVAYHLGMRTGELLAIKRKGRHADLRSQNREHALAVQHHRYTGYQRGR